VNPHHPPPNGVTTCGVLLVGGASTRFGSPKALARFRGETFAEHAYHTLDAAFGKVIVVGKAADELPLPFPVLDDGHEHRAAIIGVAAGIRLAGSELAVIVPTDMPFLTGEFLHELVAAAEGVDVAAPETGPLPGAYRRSALPALERQIAARDFALHRALEGLEVSIVPGNLELLRNVNTLEDLPV
jgi:molybdopterin-guanine dinucleotide biosynthesis protein A